MAQAKTNNYITLYVVKHYEHEAKAKDGVFWREDDYRHYVDNLTTLDPLDQRYFFNLEDAEEYYDSYGYNHPSRVQGNGCTLLKFDHTELELEVFDIGTLTREQATEVMTAEQVAKIGESMNIMNIATKFNSDEHIGTEWLEWDIVKTDGSLWVIKYFYTYEDGYRRNLAELLSLEQPEDDDEAWELYRQYFE